MKILVFGKTGQVATELQRQSAVQALDRNEVDLSDPAACAAIIRDCDADVVINAAAYTAVDNAERDEDIATIINGHAPTAMARAARDRNLPFLHISTDYVFNGQGEKPWRPRDPVSPQNAYGRSKLVGEQGVILAGGRFAILRTSWVFSAHGANFVKTMLRLSETRDDLSVVDDQIGGPTSAADIANALLKMAVAMVNGQDGGVFHFAGVPSVSWKEFAVEIFSQSDRAVNVRGIPTADYPTPAVRPLNSRMDCSDLEKVFGIRAPDWKTSLSAVLDDLKAAS